MKPAIRVAARFSIPIRTMLDLVRLAYFEELRARGMSNAEIAAVFGQSERHMRSLAARLETDFFAAERDVGFVRAIEAEIANGRDTRGALRKHFAAAAESDLEAALATLTSEGRIDTVDGRFVTSRRYVTLQTEGFKHRIDAINHFLEGGYRAVLHRVIFNDEQLATLKTISFSAIAEELKDVWGTLEGALRKDLAQLDENACFSGRSEERYTIAIALAPAGDEED
jgi:hypothetical protein